MERIINVKVGGNHLSKDSNNAGTRGEANATILRITFDESWDRYGKTVVFWDAHGLNPTRCTLTTDLWETDEENPEETPRTYKLPIPKEALGLAGEFTFVIEGYLLDENQNPIARQISVSGVLEVDDSPITDVVNIPTPSEVAQMQAQYDAIANTIHMAGVYKNNAATSAEASKSSAMSASEQAGVAQGYASTAATASGTAKYWAEQAEIHANDAVNAKDEAETSASNAQQSATNAGQYAQQVYGCVTEAKAEVEACVAEATSAVETLEQKTTTAAAEVASLKQETAEAAAEVEALEKTVGGYKAEVAASVSEASQEAEKAKDSAEEAEGFAIRAENALIKANYIGDNGNWFVWDVLKSEYVDTGIRAQAGSEVYVGANPPASADVWIDPNGDTDDVTARLNALEAIIARLTVRTTTIALLASAWTEDGAGCYQVVEITGVTPYSKVDLQPTAEQLAIFYEKDASFVTENDNGTVTVYCIGTKPTNDYIIQATITEVTEDA